MLFVGGWVPIFAIFLLKQSFDPQKRAGIPLVVKCPLLSASGDDHGQVRALGRGRSRRWLSAPVAGFATTLLLPVAGGFG